MRCRPIVLLLAALALLSCSSSAKPRPVAGWYRAQVTSADGIAVPFLLWLPSDGGAPAKFVSGSYTFEAPATREGANLRITMPIYNSEVTAAVSASGVTGTIRLFTAFGGHVTLPLTATPIAGPDLGALRDVSLGADKRAVALPAPTTFWRATFEDGTTGKLTLRALAAGGFEAVLARDTGDLTYLGGSGAGSKLVLGGFDGTAAFRLELTLGQDPHATGRFVAGQALDWRERMTLTRSEDFALHERARIAPPGGHIDLPELASMKGRPVVIEIGASWCSTCGSIAPVLHDFYRELHPRGLEMLTLLYEFSTDPAYNQAQAEKFRRAYDITWPVVAVPGDIDQVRIPGVLDPSKVAFPVVLFLDAQHNLVATQVGFPMHAGDPAYARAVAAMKSHLGAILRSP